MELFGCTILRSSLKDILAESVYPVDSRIILVPLDEHEHESWQKLDKCPRHHLAPFHGNKRCFETGETSLDLDNPFVPVVTHFAVDAFNDLCRMYVKKDVKNNVYEAQVIDVKYSPNCYGYTFSITLEAIEEDVPGVYETTVLCNNEDGRRTLLLFTRSPHLSVGERFKEFSSVVSKRSRYEAVKELKTTTKAQLKSCSSMKGKEKSAEFIRLKKDYQTVKGALRSFDKYSNSVNQVSWNKKTNPDDWFVPNKITGLISRSDEQVCGGYDYHNPLKAFSGFTSLMPLKNLR